MQFKLCGEFCNKILVSWQHFKLKYFQIYSKRENSCCGINLRVVFWKDTFRYKSNSLFWAKGRILQSVSLYFLITLIRVMYACWVEAKPLIVLMILFVVRCFGGFDFFSFLLLWVFSFKSLSVSSILTVFRQMHKKEGQRCPMGLSFTEKDVDSKNQKKTKNTILILTMNQ